MTKNSWQWWRHPLFSMCIYLLHGKEDKEQGALKLHEKKKWRRPNQEITLERIISTHRSWIPPPPPLFSIYHDGTQGEVSVWLNPQVLQEGKRKNTDSEYSGWLAWKVGTLNEWLTLWSRRWQRWRLCHHFIHCGESIRWSVKTTPITTQRNLQIKSIHHHNVPGLFEELWPLLSGVERSSASAAPDAVSAPAEAAAAPLDVGGIGVSELPAKRKKTLWSIRTLQRKAAQKRREN